MNGNSITKAAAAGLRARLSSRGCPCCEPHAATRRGFLARGAALAATTILPLEPAWGAGAPVPSLDAWLAAHQNVAAAITWHFGKARFHPFRNGHPYSRSASGRPLRAPGTVGRAD